jgi:sulfopyruvate decarboxylase subunit beta
MRRREAAAVPRTCTVRTLDGFVEAFAGAMQGGDLTTIVAKVDAVGPTGYVTELALLENRFEFQRWLRGERRGDGGRGDGGHGDGSAA